MKTDSICSVNGSKVENISVELTNNTVDYEVKRGENAQEIMVAGLDKVAAEKNEKIIFSAERKEYDTKNDGQVAIYKTAVQSNKVLYELTLSTEDNTDIGGDNNNLLTVVIPFNSTGKRNIGVYRFHDGEVDTLTTEGNTYGERIVVGEKEIILYARAFSDYAIAYTNNSGGISGGNSSSFAIKTSSTSNGSVMADKKAANYGTTVTLTVTPNKGYTLETLTVTDNNGKEVSLTKVSDTTYTFTMPSGNVAVDTTFKAVETETETEAETETLGFADVAESDYFYDAVLWAIQNNVTSGVDSTHFAPNAITTRAQMVTFLYRAAGSPDVTVSDKFADVSTDSYYAKAVAWAVEKDITVGTSDTTFSPDANVNRAQTVTFLARLAGADITANSTFTDVDADSYYAATVAWAVANGITTGTSSTTFSPADACLRAQVVTFLYRYFVKCENNTKA